TKFDQEIRKIKGMILKRAVTMSFGGVAGQSYMETAVSVEKTPIARTTFEIPQDTEPSRSRISIMTARRTSLLSNPVVRPFHDLCVLNEEDTHQVIGGTRIGARKTVDSLIDHHRSACPTVKDLEVDPGRPFHVRFDALHRCRAHGRHSGL